MSATSVFPGAEQAPAAGRETKTYATSRFGEVEIIVESIIEFPLGLVGLSGSRYALLSTTPTSPFLWLQSLENPGLALPVTNPHRFFKDFVVEVSDADGENLGLGDGRPADVYVTVTASKVVSEITVNLRAPILIRDGRGYQVLNQRPDLATKTPLFPAQPPGTAANAA